MTYANENLGPCFGQTQKCGSVKPTNVYQFVMVTQGIYFYLRSTECPIEAMQYLLSFVNMLALSVPDEGYCTVCTKFNIYVFIHSIGTLNFSLKSKSLIYW